MKSKRAIHFRLPADVTTLLKKYVSEVLPAFPRTEHTPKLFPGTVNPTKSVTLMGEQIKSRVQRATGVPTNQHLFRHLCAFMYLKQHPGDYVSLQEMLGHAEVKITMEIYCGPEREALMDNIKDALANLKNAVGLDPKDITRMIHDPKRRRRGSTFKRVRESSAARLGMG